MQFGRGSEDAIVAFGDDAVFGGEAVDDWLAVAGNDFFGGGQRGFEQAAGQDRTADETVEAIAGVVGVERDQALEGVGANLIFQQAHLGFGGIAPELTVEVLAGRGQPRACRERRRVADWVKEKIVAFSQSRFLAKHLHETVQRVRARRFVAMNSRKKANAHAIAAAARANKVEVRQLTPWRAQRPGAQMRRVRGHNRFHSAVRILTPTANVQIEWVSTPVEPALAPH